MSEDCGDFFQLLPWNFITKYHEGVVVQKNGNLQRTFGYRAPDIDSSGAFEVNTLAVRVNEFAKRLGTGWAFHLEAQRLQIKNYSPSVFESLAPYLIDRERDESFRSAGRHFESLYFLTFTWKPPSESMKKITEIFIKSGDSGDEGASMKQNVEFFVNESNSFAALLSNEMYIYPLDNEETVLYLHSSVSLDHHYIYFPNTRIFLDRILPDSELENYFPMKLGEHYIPILGINDFPDETYPAILDTLNRARLEYRWVTRYICLDKEEGLKEAKKKEKAHRGSRKSFMQTFAESTSGEASKTTNHGAGVKEEDSIQAGIEIETDQAALGYLTTCVMVWDKDLARANKKADLVKQIINSSGFTCKLEDISALQSFQAMMPGQVYASYRALPVMTNTMSHVVPLSSVWAGLHYNDHAAQVTGVGTPLIICSTIEGTPFFFNLDVGDVGHASLFGPTGAGKSTILNLIEMQFLKYPGSLCIIFDKGRSCRQSCMAVGGRFFEPAGENDSGVNFQPLRDLETDTDIQNAMDFIEACITVNSFNVPPAMRAAIKDALELLKEKPKPSRTITTFLQYVNYQDPVTNKPVFKDYLGDYLLSGKYGKIFDADTSGITLDSRFIAFEMEALMNRGENCVVPALVYLFNLIEKKFDGRLTLLVLDEAWLFLKNETFSEKIAEWLKVLRKKNVAVVFATQDVQDVASSPLKTTVIQQCLTKIYLADPAAVTPGMLQVYRDFGLTDSEIGLIASATMKRDYFYTSPQGKRLFQLDLGKLTLALIGSPDHSLLDGLEACFEKGSALCAEILSAKNINFKRFIKEDSPHDPRPVLRATPLPVQAPMLEKRPEAALNAAPESSPEDSSIMDNGKHVKFIEAVLSLPERKKNDGAGRAAKAVSDEYGVSLSTVYHARKVLKSGSPELVEKFRNGLIPVKTAFKLMKKEKTAEPVPLEQAE